MNDNKLTGVNKMRLVWIIWGNDSEGKFIAGVYDSKIRAEEDIRVAEQQPDPGAHYWIQEKEITK
jgi:hypothetical protein